MIPGNINTDLISGADEGGYQVTRSLRFNSADSAFLSRTPASAGNRKTWTWAGWVKGQKPNTYQFLFDFRSTASANPHIGLAFNNDKLSLYLFDGSLYEVTTTQVFRDYSAWFHIVLAIDTTQAILTNRARLFVNGEQVTSFSTYNFPSQNYDTPANATGLHVIGAYPTPDTFFSGYLADIHFIDGQALDPTSFTEVDATTGQLIPKAYTGSFGTNGFWLKFSDNSAATATTLGKDYSGNSNNWTPNNLSVTAGAGNDSLVDTPTSYGTDDGLGGSVRGNYCTVNPLDNGGITIANGNLDLSTTSGSDLSIRGTVGISSGKWYWEVTATNLVADPFNKISVVGIATVNSVLPSYVGSNATSWGYVNHNGTKVTNGSAASYGNSWVTNDVIGVAFDADNGRLFFSKNGTWQASGDPAAGTNAAYTGLTSGPYAPAFNLKNTGASESINFGQRQWAYAAPAGFKALCDTNLPTPVVAKPSTVMDVKLYTGNGSTQTVSGLGFSPDLVWIKGRSTSSAHNLYDSIRGRAALFSNATNAELALAAGKDFDTFTSDGFTLLTPQDTAINNSGVTFAAWTWDAGSSTSSNGSGSITSQVRANASSGFSVVSWSGVAGANGTIGHGLGVAPQFVILKNRGTADNWRVYHVSVGATGFLQLASTGATVTSDEFQNTSPTSSVFYLRGNTWNAASNNYIAYFFAPVAGYSAFGSYTGNGSADGPFVFTGMRPRYLLIKRTDAVSSWEVYDAARNPSNLVTQLLEANTSGSEFTGTTNYVVDFLSNGFKPRGTFADLNASGGTYVWAAFAESPFQYARAR